MSNPATFQAPFRFHRFQYGQVELSEAAYIGTTPYFTRKAIGEWLGYQDPQNAIDVIVKRNPHISNPEWATPVKLTGVEGGRTVTREMEIYSPIGLQLIVFESRQPKAVAYKVAVARLVNDIMTGEYGRRFLAGLATGEISVEGWCTPGSALAPVKRKIN